MKKSKDREKRGSSKRQEKKKPKKRVLRRINRKGSNSDYLRKTTRSAISNKRGKEVTSH